MSLMNNIRQATESGSVKLILGVLVMVFIFWGIGGGNNQTSKTLAEVHGTRITDTKYQKRMREVVNSQGRTLSDEDQSALSNQVLNQLIVEEAIKYEADKLGLQVSNDELALALFEIKAFQDEQGKFSTEIYERFLKRRGYKRGPFEDDLRNQLIQQKLAEIAAASVAVGETEIKEYWFKSETKIELEYVRITPLNFYDDVQPAADEILKYITEHPNEISAWYREHYDARFHKPVRAQVHMIQLRNDLLDTSGNAVDDAGLNARMDKIRAEFEAGADFADLARKYSEHITGVNGGDLGLVVRDQLDAPIAEAIFGTATAPLEGPGLRQVVVSAQGLNLLKVDEYLPEQTTSEADARSEIALAILQEQQAPELAKKYADDLRTAWKTSSVIPQDFLDLQKFTLATAGPVSLTDTEIKELPGMKDLLRDLATAAAGEVLDRVFSTEGALYAVRVATRTEPEESNYALERDRIQARLTLIRKAEFMQTWRDDLVASANVERFVNFK